MLKTSLEKISNDIFPVFEANMHLLKSLLRKSICEMRDGADDDFEVGGGGGGGGCEDDDDIFTCITKQHQSLNSPLYNM